MGKRHHFVPRFYLAAFSGAPRRINLFNLKRSQLIAEASLRDQCYVHRLYGSNDEIESALAQIEDLAAEVFRIMRNRHIVPGGGTPERDALMMFLGLQMARTTAAQANAVASSRLLANVAFDGSPPKEFETTADDAMRMMLAAAPTVVAAIRDLSVTLVLADSSGISFVTSDNPVFKYNSYCEGITDFGVTGAIGRGLQLFLPVSPQLLIYLFDPVVYKLARTRSRLVSATRQDVEALNRLQLVGATENIYFAQRELGIWIGETASTIQPIRAVDKPRITRAVEEGNERSELLHEYWPMPQLGLQLSFVSIRPGLQRVPLLERIRQVRTPYRRETQTDDSSGVVRRFEVRSQH